MPTRVVQHDISPEAESQSRTVDCTLLMIRIHRPSNDTISGSSPRQGIYSGQEVEPSHIDREEICISCVHIAVSMKSGSGHMPYELG